MQLTLEITQKCNVFCPWCSSSASDEGQHMPYGDVVSLLRKHIGSCSSVRISGGEPVLHPEIWQIVGFAKQIGYATILMTNGHHYMRTPTVRDNYNLLDKVVVNAMSKESLRAVRWMKKQGLSVQLEVVLVKDNKMLLGLAVSTSIRCDIPLRMLVLQKQGRGVDCDPIDTIDINCSGGCVRDSKVMIDHQGVESSCSALKYQSNCSMGGSMSVSDKFLSNIHNNRIGI